MPAAPRDRRFTSIVPLFAAMARDSIGCALGMLAEVKDPVRLLRRIAVTVVGTVILAVRRRVRRARRT